MISHEKLHTMLKMQDALNQKIHPLWQSQGYKWTRAIMVEAVEALDHYGWKWWKKQEPDLPQVRIELIDIWHFMLSHELESFGDADKAAGYLAAVAGSDSAEYLAAGGTRELFELLIASAASNRTNMAAFMALKDHCGLSWGDLYMTYVAKNVLNTFRQDHGYKDGSYIKIWDGVEDNVALERLIALKPNATPDQLRAKLESIYTRVCAAVPA